jgi:hypothetical protein
MVLVLGQSRTIANLLIGLGPGVLSSSALLGQTAASSSASLNGALDWATSATKWLLEVGLLGILLYLATIGSAVAAVARSWASCADEWGVAVTAAAAGSAAVFVAAALYANPWNTDAMAVLFWCLMGMATKWGRLRLAEREPKRNPGACLKTASNTGA